jgi:hypothetical protein
LIGHMFVPQFTLITYVRRHLGSPPGPSPPPWPAQPAY